MVAGVRVVAERGISILGVQEDGRKVTGGGRSKEVLIGTLEGGLVVSKEKPLYPIRIADSKC